MSKKKIIIIVIAVVIAVVLISLIVYKSADQDIPEEEQEIIVDKKIERQYQYDGFLGSQSGTIVKDLLVKMISRVNDYNDEPEMIPTIYVEKLEDDGEEIQIEYNSIMDREEYLNSINMINSSIKEKHVYFVEISYRDDTDIPKSVPERVMIYYNKK